ncbi:nitronate monooxygenase [Ruegeria denitrificans]|uniref:nitronate monooxygenase n=1 Tax=Ruegeria denitrificans TaxID=1715692 RepID=UPI00071C20ED|nr:nitronate monooxygenase [Ruegeria denitrificans]
MTQKAEFLDRMGLDMPIIQAPMAGVSTPQLAANVSNSGGLGSLGLCAMNTEAARKAIRDTKALTNGAFNVNAF